MYSVTLGFDAAVDRIKALQKNGHDAEALVTAVFTFEKTVRRGLKISILARGFSGKQAMMLIGRKGFGELKELWPIFDKSYRGLPDFVGNKHWQNLPKAVEMRNKMVHGSNVYKLSKCKEMADHVLGALSQLRTKVLAEYGRDPWERIGGRRKPKLQWLV